MRALHVTLFAAGLAAVASLPLAGRALRRGGEPRCALDGVALVPGAIVKVTDVKGRESTLCCIDCATSWIRRTRGTLLVRVADETTKELVDEASAWFVRSRVPANAATGCRVHAFVSESDASRHAAAYGGFVLSGAERPFRVRE